MARNDSYQRFNGARKETEKTNLPYFGVLSRRLQRVDGDVMNLSKSVVVVHIGKAAAEIVERSVGSFFAKQIFRFDDLFEIEHSVNNRSFSLLRRLLM